MSCSTEHGTYPLDEHIKDNVKSCQIQLISTIPVSFETVYNSMFEVQVIDAGYCSSHFTIIPKQLCKMHVY